MHERFGQDAVIRIVDSGSDETVAVQFKSSRSSTRSEMEMPELIEILRSFDASQREARKEGRTINRFVLVTSKSLGLTCRSVVQKRHDPKPHSELSRRIKANLPWVRKDYRSREDALKALHEVLGQLNDPIENATFDSSVRQLETFARHLGLDERETREGIERITGSMLERTTRGSLPITKEWLNECLASAPDARMLRLALQGETARSTAAVRLSQKLSSQFGSSQGELIPKRPPPASARGGRTLSCRFPDRPWRLREDHPRGPVSP